MIGPAAPSTTANPSAVAVVLLLLCAMSMSAAAASGNDLVATTCAAVDRHDWSPRLSGEECESALRSDKRSSAAKHPQDLALIAMDLVERAAADAAAKVQAEAMSSHGRFNETQLMRLRYCRLDYGEVARTVPVCRAMVRKFKELKDDDKPKGLLLAAADYLECPHRLRSAAWSCWENIWGHDELMKAASHEVKLAYRRSNLAQAMVEEMIGVVVHDH